MRRDHRDWLASTEYSHQWDGPPMMIGANMAFSRQVLTKVPAFDLELGPGGSGFWDETLFSFQLNEAGYRIHRAFDVVAEHHFDEARLRRASFLADAKKRGRGLAYIKHHWEHGSIPHPRLQLALTLYRLVKWRMKNTNQATNSEGIAPMEMWLVLHTYRLAHYLLERRRPRTYEKRGLVKRLPA